MATRKKMLVADLLCGAGGSSTGAARALEELGLEMELVCLNHWPVAIDTHKRNHPEARHYCQDIATVRPHLIVPEGYLDLLMASPTCTHHSVARGGKPTSDQQRSDPWHIITWLTELDVRRIIIENVWEFVGWGPVDPKTGRPIKERKGEYFAAWTDVIRKLGFELDFKKLNAANYGDATTRQRFILKGRNDGKPVGWAPLTHSKRPPGKDLDLFSAMQPWRAAREIIDWNIRGQSIITRKRPLAPKTIARILAGAIKFKWPAPFIVILMQQMERSLKHMIAWAFARRHHPKKEADRAKRRKLVRDTIARLRDFRAAPEKALGGAAHLEPLLITLRQNNATTTVSEPVSTISANGKHIGVAEPVIMNGRRNNQAKPVSTEPIPTLDTKGGVWLAEPLVLSQNSSGAARSTEDPLPTILTGGAADADHPGCARPAIVEPFILNRHGENGGVRAHSVEEPIPTADNRGAGYVVEPFVTTVAHGNEDGDATADSRRVHSVDEPLGAMHAGGNKFGVAEAFVLSQASGGAPRSVDEPIPTQTTGGNGAAHALISPYYGSGSGENCSSAEEPLPTATAKARFGVVVPVTNGSGGPAARDLEEPLPTMTTAKGGEFAVVIPLTHEGGADRVIDIDDPLPTITGANRGEHAFITAQHGERPGQAPRVHDINDPAPTIAATGHVDLVQAGDGYDILFRMLEPHELAAAMGFNRGDKTYEFAGTKTEQVKQIGNAVSVAMMTAEVKQFMADAAPRRKKMPEEAEAIREDIDSEMIAEYGWTEEDFERQEEAEAHKIAAE